MDNKDNSSVPAPDNPTTSKWGFLKKLNPFGKSTSSPASQPESITKESVTSESDKNPEDLKNELLADLMQLAHFQDQVLIAKEEKRHGYRSYYRLKQGDETPEQYRQRIDQESDDTKQKQLAEALIQQMEAAQAQLGDFCVVVKDGDKKGVVLLSPIERTVRQRVYTKQGAKETPESYGELQESQEHVLYDKDETTQEIFFVSPRGLAKFSLPTKREYDMSQGGEDSKAKWFQDSFEQSKKQFDRYKYDALSGLYNVLENKSDAGRGGPANYIVESARMMITGNNIPLNDDRQSVLNIAFGSDFLQQHIPVSWVTTAEDVEEVFKDSVTQAQKKQEAIAKGENSYRTTGVHLFTGETKFN